MKPGKKYDQHKIRFDLLDPRFAEGVAKILTFGAVKYGENNWQNLVNFIDRYYAATERHLTAWRKGEILDKESGLHHLLHAACNLFFILWKENYGLRRRGGTGGGRPRRRLRSRRRRKG